MFMMVTIPIWDGLRRQNAVAAASGRENGEISPVREHLWTIFDQKKMIFDLENNLSIIMNTTVEYYFPKKA